MIKSENSVLPVRQAVYLDQKLLFPLVFQILSNWTYVILAMLLLFSQSWFACQQFDPASLDHRKKIYDSTEPLPFSQASWWTKSENYEAAALGILVTASRLTISFSHHDPS